MNPRKRKDEAAEALAKGKWDKAAKLYSGLAADFPDDAQILVRLGEVQRKLGRNEEAIDAWLRAGRRFEREGHFLRAVAAFKLVLEVAPDHAEAESLLDELHEQRFGRPRPGSSRERTPVPPQAPAVPPASQRTVAPPAASAAPIGPPVVVARIATTSIAVPRPPPEPTPGPNLDELLFDVEIDVEGVDDPLGPELPPIPLFADLDPESFRRLLQRSHNLHLSPGELAVREGERGDSFYVVVRGLLEVVRQDGARLGELQEGAFFGEIALLTGSPRTASVRALQETDLLQFTASDLRHLVRQHPGVAAALRRFYRQRLLSNALATAPIFRHLDPAARSRLIGRFRTREVAAGEEVLREGAPTEGLFVVLHGSLDVLRLEGGRERRIGTLGQGDLFGEQSLLHDRTVGATCRARSRGMLLRLPREDFAELISHPAVRHYLGALDRERTLQNSQTPPERMV